MSIHEKKAEAKFLWTPEFKELNLRNHPHLRPGFSPRGDVNPPLPPTTDAKRAKK